jgi:hypothetical protein
MAKRFVPLLIGEGAPPLRAPSVRSLRTNAKRRPKKKAAKKSKRKARKRPKAKTPLRGGRRGKRGGTVKAAGKFEHLRVRSPSSFKKTPSLKTIPWMFNSAADRAFVKKKLGLRVIPKGTKTISGSFKPGARKDRVPGKRVKYLGNGIQTVLIPIKGGKKPKSPRGTKRKTRKAVKRIVKRARKNPLRLNHHTTKPGRGKYAKICVKIYGPIKSQASTLKNPAPKRRPDLEAWVAKDGWDTVYRSMQDYKVRAIESGNRAVANATASDLKWLSKHRKKLTRKNPGRLAILANPLPKAVEECARALRGEKRKRFLSYYSSLKPADRKRLAKGLQLYKKRHKVPCTDFELKKVKGTRVKVEVGVGRAAAIEYHANKGYKGSSKKGDPYRHEFENGQHVVSDENGRKLEVVDRKGAKRKTVTTDWIYH